MGTPKMFIVHPFPSVLENYDAKIIDLLQEGSILCVLVQTGAAEGIYRYTFRWNEESGIWALLTVEAPLLGG